MGIMDTQTEINVRDEILRYAKDVGLMADSSSIPNDKTVYRFYKNSEVIKVISGTEEAFEWLSAYAKSKGKWIKIILIDTQRNSVYF